MTPSIEKICHPCFREKKPYNFQQINQSVILERFTKNLFFPYNFFLLQIELSHALSGQRESTLLHILILISSLYDESIAKYATVETSTVACLIFMTSNESKFWIFTQNTLLLHVLDHLSVLFETGTKIEKTSGRRTFLSSS